MKVLSVETKDLNISIPIRIGMTAKVHEVKCDECDRVIEGISEKEVNAWLEQHKHYAHKK